MISVMYGACDVRYGIVSYNMEWQELGTVESVSVS